MGKLAHIRSGMSAPTLDGFLRPIADYVAHTLAANLAEDMQRGGEGLESIKGAVAALEPALKAALDKAIDNAIGKLSGDLSATAAEVRKSGERLTGTQRALMQAIASIRIPDHSEQLGRLELKNVDLSPLERQIEAVLLKMDIDTPEPRPKRWDFKVIRHERSGLIDRVVATAE